MGVVFEWTTRVLQSQEAWFPLVVVRQAAEGQAGLETTKSTDSTLLTASGRQASREPGRSTDTLTHTHTNTHTHRQSKNCT